jgi:hypothetical protein
MNKACQISKRLIVLMGTVALSITGFASVASADTEVDSSVVIVVSDDIMKRTTDLSRSGDDGNGNNGHGNNADGVDSSNPGEGDGGPNDGVDPSGGVDDEAGGGGASPSNSND